MGAGKGKPRRGVGAAELPALAGGKPVRDLRLPYATQWITGREISAVTRVLEGEWITSGPTIERFEQAFCEAVGCRYAVAVNSGTSALIIAVRAAGIGPQDQVITTPMTFHATALSIVESGGRPVLVDVEDDTLNIDPEKVHAAVTPRTRAVIPVHYGGHPCDLKPIRALARDRGLALIEDAAHAVDAEYGGERIGSRSPAACFSFHPVKNMTLVEGGLIATRNKKFADHCRRLRFFGIERDARARDRQGGYHYAVTERGLKANTTDIQAALGLVQLDRLPGFQRRRRQIVKRYHKLLADEPAVRLPVERPGHSSAWHLFPIRIDPDRLTIDRDCFFKGLQAEGLGVNVHYIPIHFHPYWRKILDVKPGDLPVAEEAFRRLISIPLFPKMTNADVDDVVAAVKRLCNYYRR